MRRIPYAIALVALCTLAVELLLTRGVKLVVVACNTASAEALGDLQSSFDVPVVGVIEPGVRASVAATKIGKIGVIGTAGTIGSGAYQAGISNLSPDTTVVAAPCPLFVPLAEEGWVDTPVTEAVARQYLRAFSDTGIDSLVLGCTHYPLLSGVIGRVMGTGVTLVDSAVETAREVMKVLDERSLRNGEGRKGEFTVVLSDTSAAFKEVGERFLGHAIGEIEMISVS